MSDNVLLVTVDGDTNPYTEGLNAIQHLAAGGAIDQPATIRFQNDAQLTDVFNERTFALLRVIRDEGPESIRETARLVGRDKKNVHEELTTLETLGVIRFEERGRSKRPVFPYDQLVVAPFAREDSDGAEAAP